MTDLGHGSGRRAQRCGAPVIAAYREVRANYMPTDVNLAHLVKVRSSSTKQVGKLRLGQAKLLVPE